MSGNSLHKYRIKRRFNDECLEWVYDVFVNDYVLGLYMGEPVYGYRRLASDLLSEEEGKGIITKHKEHKEDEIVYEE